MARYEARRDADTRAALDDYEKVKADRDALLAALRGIADIREPGNLRDAAEMVKWMRATARAAIARADANGGSVVRKALAAAAPDLLAALRTMVFRMREREAKGYPHINHDEERALDAARAAIARATGGGA